MKRDISLETYVNPLPSTPWQTLPFVGETLEIEIERWGFDFHLRGLEVVDLFQHDEAEPQSHGYCRTVVLFVLTKRAPS